MISAGRNLIISVERSARWISVAAGLALLAASVPALGESAVRDRLSSPGPVTFDGTAYQLAWSSQPSPTYLKQEYVPAGQAVKTYTSMVLLEVLAGDMTPVEAAAAQMKTLNARKAKDPLVRMDMIRNDKTGEVLLDFLISSKDAKGNTIVEWNAYRYLRHIDRSGDKGLLLFAVSRRAYGNDEARTFLQSLKTERPTLRNALIGASLPDIDWTF